jgi:hypothetical protein
MVEVTDSDKHSSLLQKRVNNDLEKKTLKISGTLFCKTVLQSKNKLAN